MTIGTPPSAYPPVDSAAVNAAAIKIAHALTARVWAAVTERDLQIGIAEVLKGIELRVEREYRLTDRDRLDFAIIVGDEAPDILVIETKIDGSRVDTARQIARYAGHARVGGVMLVTTSARIAAGFRARILGRQCFPVVVRRI